MRTVLGCGLQQSTDYLFRYIYCGTSIVLQVVCTVLEGGLQQTPVLESGLQQTPVLESGLQQKLVF